MRKKIRDMGGQTMIDFNSTTHYKNFYVFVLLAVIGVFFIGCVQEPNSNNNQPDNGNGDTPISFDVSNLQEWNAVVNAINEGKDDAEYAINILDDFSKPGNSFYIGEGTPTFTSANITVTIQGNNTISLSPGGGSLLAINAGQEFILKDVNLRGTSGSASLVYIYGGSLTMQGEAAIFDNSPDSFYLGGGVHVVNGGTFIMQGNSSVFNNTRGGVLVTGSAFIMEDNASVHNNKHGSGNIGGVSVTQDGSLIMRGDASVFDNTGRSAGGGVRVLSGSRFRMYGYASISNNTLVSGTENQFGGNGAGVYVDMDSFFDMSGNALIHGNFGGPLTEGGGVHVYGSSAGVGRFTMQGGTISGNTASVGLGGGVFVNGIFQMTNGIIYGNDAGENSNKPGSLQVGTFIDATAQMGTFSSGGIFTGVNLITTDNDIAATREITVVSIAQMEEILPTLPANTITTPHTIVLNVDDLLVSGQFGNYTGVTGILQNNPSKFINLDLSGSTITSIMEYAFWNCTSLINVTIPDSVTTIGDYGFWGCTSLINVTIPDSVTTIGDYAFSGCTSLINATIPGSVTSIGAWPFSDCINLNAIEVNPDNTTFSSADGVLYNKDKTTLIRYPPAKANTTFSIPDSVITIGQGAFGGCNNLVNVTIPNSVISIGEWAFSRCTSLINVTIPDNVTTIGREAFSGCSSLLNVSIGSGITAITPIIFSGCTSLAVIVVDLDNTAYSSTEGVLYNKDKTTLIFYPPGKSDSTFTIPDSVITVGSNAFRFSDNLINITISNSVITIMQYAFQHCTSLTNVTIGNGVTTIGIGVFGGCFSLASVTFLGTIPATGFNNVSDSSFPGNLRDVFYSLNAANGTPGIYTTENPGWNVIWSMQ